MRGLAHLMPARADGTNPAAVTAFHRMDAVRDRFRRGHGAWPVTSGAYVLGDPEGSVAICVLTSEELCPGLARLPGVAIAGKVTVPNLGIEKIVRNITSNPRIRHLLVCGTDSPVFHPGEALQQLHRDGVDAERRIIGARGHLPVLAHVTNEQIDAFRSQVTLVDLTGETDQQVIGARAQQLAAQQLGAFPSGPVPDVRQGDDFAVLRPGGRREPLAYDPHGFFVVGVDVDARRIEVRHYRTDTSPGHLMTGHSAEAMWLGLIREDLVSQLSHAAYLGAELTKAETALRLGLDYHQDRPLR
ncbi:MAG: DUF4346 domain-containing protein [Arachnia sp.]